MINVPHVPGIYQIRNIVNGHVYIGSSIDMHRRHKEHMLDLKQNKHGNSYLQRAYNKYGEKSFTFEILECVADKDLLRERESYYIHIKSDSVGVYNLTTSTFQPKSCMKPIICLETQEIWDGISECSRELGVKVEHLSYCCRGIFNSIRGRHYMYLSEYQSSSEEDIKIWLSKPIGRRKEVICLETQEIFESTSQLARHLGVKTPSVITCCTFNKNINRNITRNTSTVKGKHYMYVSDYSIKTEEEIQNILNYTPRGWKKVKCIESGEVYNSIAEAARLNNTTERVIYSSAKGLKQNYKPNDLHWVYIN